MPFIGFESERPTEEKIVTEEDIEVLEERQKRATEKSLSRDSVFLSERKLEELRKIYSVVVVHDYGDDYHKSKEEIEAKNQISIKYSEIANRKRKLRNIVEYISLTRKCIDYLNAVADSQDLYSRKEFIHLWAIGDIDVYGMYLPEYKGKDKKSIDRSYLADYILSDEPAELFNKHEEVAPLSTEEELEELLRLHYTPEEWAEICCQTMIEMHEGMSFDEEVALQEGKYDDETKTLLPMNNKKWKKFLKNNPGLRQIINENEKKNEAAENEMFFARNNMDSEQRSLFAMEQEDMELVNEIDMKLSVKKGDAEPVFEGSIMDSDALKEYYKDLEDWEYDHLRVNQNGQWISQDELTITQLQRDLDSMGVNIRLFFGNDVTPNSKGRVQKFGYRYSVEEENLRSELQKHMKKGGNEKSFIKSVKKGKDKHKKRLLKRMIKDDILYNDYDKQQDRYDMIIKRTGIDPWKHNPVLEPEYYEKKYKQWKKKHKKGKGKKGKKEKGKESRMVSTPLVNQKGETRQETERLGKVHKKLAKKARKAAERQTQTFKDKILLNYVQGGDQFEHLDDWMNHMESTFTEENGFITKK